MTNIEMIQKLETDGLSSVSDMDFITNALEENDKLKAEIDDIRVNLKATYNKLHHITKICKEYQAEIEQLKLEYSEFEKDYELISMDFVNVCEEIEQLKLEVDYYKNECCLQGHINNELKSELEQSVKLPCSQWNLCVDKMPSVITGNYIVCLENEAIMMANYSAFSNKFKEISTMGMRDFYDDNKVVAWMELPQSLKGKVEE